MTVFLVLILIGIVFGEVYVVWSDSPTGSPGEKKEGAVWVLGTFRDPEKALFFSEEVKLRTGRDVFVGRFRSKEDFRLHLEKINLSYLRSCVLEMLKKRDFPPYFNEKAFKEDLRKLLRELEKAGARGRFPCREKSLEEFTGLLRELAGYSRRVKFLLEVRKNLEGYEEWRRNFSSKIK